MSSPESEKQSGESQNFNELQAKYRNLVERSSVLNEKDKRAMLDFLNSEEGKNPDSLQKMIEHFPEAEKSAEKMNREYHAQLAEATLAGRFAKKSMDAYEKWFRELSFKEKTEFIHNKSTSLHDPKRQKVLDAFNGKTEFGGVFIPAAVRNEFRREFFDSDLENREALLKRIAAQHKKLKEKFLALPKETQDKYRGQFKELGLAGREKLLNSFASKTNEKSIEQKGAVKIEAERLYGNFCAETKRMVKDNLLSPASKLKYDEWFKALPLDRKRSLSTRSELRSKMRERINVRDNFYKLIKDSPSAAAKYELKFRNADLDERKFILDSLKKEKPSRKTGWIRSILRRLTLSSAHSDIKEKLETYAVANEIAERRHRFRLAHHTRKESVKKAEKRGLNETARESRKLEQAAGAQFFENSAKSGFVAKNANFAEGSFREAEGGIKVKLDALKQHTEARSKWKRMLKPNIDNKNAKLSADITLRTKSGEEVIDEKAFQRGELERELDSVRKAVTPIIEAEARSAGIDATKKQIGDELKKADWERYGKETIKKAA